MSRPCTVEETTYHGARAYRLSNGIVAAVVVPELGGRVMSLKLGGREVFFSNEAELSEGPPWRVEGRWRNFGGYKMWPAPQGRWGGPPDPKGGVLDSGAYTAEATSDPDGAWCAILLTSPDDPVTGLRFQREIRLEYGTARVIVGQRMTNISDEPVTWSIWDVTQVPGRGGDTSAWIYFPLRRRKDAPGFVLQAGEADNPTWVPDAAPGVMGARYTGRIGKIGAIASGDWMALRLGDLVYAKRFPSPSPGEEYPDGGVNVEIWSNPDPPYMEMEILGPLATLDPGETAELTEEWMLAVASPDPVVAVSADAVALGPVRVRIEGGKAHLAGTVAAVRGTPVFVLANGPQGGWTVIAEGSAQPDRPLDLSSLDLPATVEIGGRSTPIQGLTLTVCTGARGDFILLCVVGPAEAAP